MSKTSEFEIGMRVRGGRVVFIDPQRVYVLGPSGVLSALPASAVERVLVEEGAERLGQCGSAPLGPLFPLANFRQAA